MNTCFKIEVMSILLSTYYVHESMCNTCPTSSYIDTVKKMLHIHYGYI